MAIKFVTIDSEPARKPAAAAPAVPAAATGSAAKAAPASAEHPKGPAGELPLGQTSKPEKPKRKPK